MPREWERLEATIRTAERDKRVAEIRLREIRERCKHRKHTAMPPRGKERMARCVHCGQIRRAVDGTGS